MGKGDTRQALVLALCRLLRPLARILLRNGMSYGAFSELVKRMYVEVATNEFKVGGRKQTVSRVAVLTGLSRKEVSRVQNLPSLTDDNGLDEKHNRAARVVTAWLRDKDFSDGQGNPVGLPFEGSPSFSELVKKYSGDMPPRAVLDELIHSGAVTESGDDRFKLAERGYIPKTGEIEKLGILGSDVAGLISTIDRNLKPDTKERFFQRKVFYDNLPKEVITQLQSLAEKEGQSLLELLDRWMAERDQGEKESGTPSNERVKAGIGVYYFEEANSEEKK